MVWIDDDGLAAAGARLDGVDGRIDGIRGRALGQLATIGRWGDHGSVGALLDNASTTIGGVAADYTVRVSIAHQLDLTAWLGLTGVFAWSGGSEPAPGLTTEHDDRIEELEDAIRNAQQGPGFYGQGQAIAQLRAELADARRERVRALQDRFPQSSGVPQAYYDLLRSEIAREITLLGYDDDDLQDVATAMMNGQTPAEAGLDPILFPPPYLARSADLTDFRDELDRLATDLDEAWEAAAAATYLDQGAAWEAYYDIVEEYEHVRDTMNERFPNGLDVDFAYATSFLNNTYFLDATGRDEAIGEYLAEALFADVELVDVAAAADRHLTSERRAVIFYDHIPNEWIPLIPTMSNLPPADAVQFARPFAEALAMASHSEDFDLTGAELVDGHTTGLSAAWFLVDGYDPDFLTEVAIAQVEADLDIHPFPFRTEQIDGVWINLDPRALVAAQIADHGHAASAELVAQLIDQDLLAPYVDPTTGYGDAGYGVGAVLEQLGGGDVDVDSERVHFDPADAALMVEVMRAIGETDPLTGILVGSAAMMAPHLPSLLTATEAGDLVQTPLADLVDSDDAVVQAYLSQVMDHQPSADVMFEAATWHLVLNLGNELDPTDPTSISATTTGFGNLMDLVLSTYLDEGLADAQRQDRINGIISGVVGVAIDLLVGAGLATAAAWTAPAWLAFAVAAATSDFAGATITNVIIPEITDWGLSTDNVEGVLESGYSIENTYVHTTRLMLFDRLAQAGVVTLPADWYQREGGLMAVTLDEWEAYQSELAAQFPDENDFYVWLTAAHAVGGELDWDPND